MAAGAPPTSSAGSTSPRWNSASTSCSHPAVNLILATGGPGMVHAAYSSGKPAIGVGAGNTPVVIDETADIKRAVASILMSKTFDNGVVCASEQAVIVVESVYDAVRERFAQPRRALLRPRRMRGGQAGDPGGRRAQSGHRRPVRPEDRRLAGIQVPSDTRVLMGEVTSLGPEEAFAHEKLSPTLGLYRARDFQDAVSKAEALVALGGTGHTSALYTDQDRQGERVALFGARMKTARILINTLLPGRHRRPVQLQAGPFAHPGLRLLGRQLHLRERGPPPPAQPQDRRQGAENMLWFRLPRSVYFRRGCLPFALEDLRGTPARRHRHRPVPVQHGTWTTTAPAQGPGHGGGGLP